VLKCFIHFQNLALLLRDICNALSNVDSLISATLFLYGMLLPLIAQRWDDPS
jgi:hypothetical protein